jgi:hypothetical protein
MAVESDRVPSEGKPATQPLYTRNSTGFVRELKLLDQITYSWTASTPLVCIDLDLIYKTIPPD